MALRFVDSCGDHYSTAQPGRKWNITSGPGTVQAGGGRRGTNGLSLANTVIFGKVLDAQATWIVGMSLKLATMATFGTGTLIALYDNATEQMSLRMDAAGHLIASRAGATLGTSVAVFTVGEHYLEFKVLISDTVGTYEIRLDGVNVLSGSAADTKNTANATADTIRFGDSFLNSTPVMDDVYICDGTGARNNNFLGDVRVDCLFPSGAGANTGLTPNTGTNFGAVDETTANDDTDYVSSAVVGTKDTYAFGDLSHNPVSVFGVQVVMTAKKDDAGARSIASVTRSAGADTDGASQAVSTAYTMYREIIEQNPNGPADWTKTTVNAAEWGAKVAA
jgi:hypothetical protein